MENHWSSFFWKVNLDHEHELDHNLEQEANYTAQS